MATLLAFHAHPDDEALLNAGTLARAAAEGHRVVLVVATDGQVHDASTVRLRELEASAAVLGVARTVHLGYADSGHGAELYPDPPGRTRFVRADTEDAARRLAALLREERVDLLLSYDANGGYGHRDHVKVHHVGKRAAELAGTPRVLESTVPRDHILRLVQIALRLRLIVRHDPAVLATKFSPASAITHRIDVRRFAGQKRAAISAHRSQIGGTGRTARLVRQLIRLPSPVFGALFGREWFVEQRR